MSVAAWDKAGNEAQTTVKVNLDPGGTQDCDLLTKELCYWKTVSYRLFENRRATVIGSISSPYLAEMCPTHEVRYTLLNGECVNSLLRNRVYVEGLNQ